MMTRYPSIIWTDDGEGVLWRGNVLVRNWVVTTRRPEHVPEPRWWALLTMVFTDIVHQIKAHQIERRSARQETPC